ncbi:MAG: serine O-acetyltransferase [Clostridia bacterium]|nr:serine O-acetyltransferase [Clostridia bacterium]
MTQNGKESLSQALHGILDNYRNEDLPLMAGKKKMPNQKEITDIILDLHRVLFPGFFDKAEAGTLKTEDGVEQLLFETYYRLKNQIILAFDFFAEEGTSSEVKATEVCNRFFASLPAIQKLLQKDVVAGFNGDPAAKSKEEVIFCYPGFYAISVYRMAHELYKENVPLIPRIMTEHAHSNFGIDINSGATIGENFFIDHGTGIVIGETCVIGNNVKLYQGVTLGALSTRGGQMLSGVRRHPTVKDNVTIYAGATILGGDTVIGENSVIGGNCFITKPIPPNTKVFAALQELTLKPSNINKE